jgi:hypothetical protein
LESDGRRTREVKAEDSRRTNVVPFPRDWIGPQEEFVPFGQDPSARREPTAGSATGAIERPVGPSDFWDEASWAIQNPLEGPAIGETALDETAVDETVVDETVVDEMAVDETAVDEAAGENDAFDWETDNAWHRNSSRLSRLRFTRARRLRPGELAVVGAVALALVALVVSRVGGSTSTRSDGRTSSAAVQHHATAIGGARPRSTVVPSQPHRIAKRHSAKRHHPSARHQPAATGRKSSGSTQSGRPASESVAAQSGGQAQQASSVSSPPSGSGGQSVSHTATTSSQTHPSPPTGPSGRHALLGPGVCGGCK